MDIIEETKEDIMKVDDEKKDDCPLSTMVRNFSKEILNVLNERADKTEEEALRSLEDIDMETEP